jgi:cytochrome c oxidase subunit 4
MEPQEQAELWMALRDRMKVNWTEMTMQEKKACKCLGKLQNICSPTLTCETAYWIAFGPHGPRAIDPPGEGWRVAGLTTVLVGIGCVMMYLIHMQAKPAPKTMSLEWQEASNEYLKVSRLMPCFRMILIYHRVKTQIRSLVSRAKDTKAKA